MRKKILALLTVIALSFSIAGCGTLKNVSPAQNSADGSSSAAKGLLSSQDNEDEDGNKLELFKSDFSFTPEEKALRIKSEYLRENGGYSDDDEIVAILSLPENSVIENYAESSSKLSVSDYAASSEGAAYAEKIAAKQNALIARLDKSGLIYGVEYTYKVAANAVAVKTNYANYRQMKNLVGGDLSSIEISDSYSRPQAASSSSGGGAVENEVEVYADTGIYDASDVGGGKYTGKHTAIAILDSGFDMSHQVFKYQPQGELMFTENTIRDKLAADDAENRLNAKQITPDLSVGDVYYSEKIPYAYDYCGKDADVFPHDSEHGTHVAGIIGGWLEEENHRGVARDTQLVLMKVFPDNTNIGAETPDILAALEDAVILGVDAINMSLGASCGFSEESVPGDESSTDPKAQQRTTVDRVYASIEEAGISLLVAASNSYSSAYGGAEGNTNKVTNPDSATVGNPSTYASALSVASISGVKTSYLLANGDPAKEGSGDVIFFSESANNMGDKNDFFKDITESLKDKTAGVDYVGSKDADGTYHLEYVTVPGIGDYNNYSAIKNEIKGRIAVVRRGTNSFEEKAVMAELNGAIGILVYNNVEGDALPMSLGNQKRIPAASLSKADGLKLIATDGGTLVLDPDNKAGPFISDFSSWGPMPDLTLKPEITAHGGDILSSIPGGEYERLSGTSMATPNLAGLMVLIRQYVKEHPLFEDMEAREQAYIANQLMMSTATIAKDKNGNPVSPRKQGAGLASLKNLVSSQGYLTAYDKDGKATTRSKLELMDDPDKKGVYVMEFDVVNISSEAASYDISLTPMTESVSETNRYYVAEQAQLLSSPNITVSMTGGDGSLKGRRVTVNAAKADEPSRVHIKLTYNLAKADKELIDKLFPNGMYVEGYLKLDNAAGAEATDLNMPFLAFYGDWTRAPLFDKTYYEVEAEAHNNALDEDEKLKADYYATTPFGSYNYNYIIPLGNYLYDLDESTYGAIPASEDKIAISNYLGTVDGIMGVYAGLLRNAKSVEYTVTDKLTGELLYSYVKYNQQKAFSQGGDPIPSAENLRISSAALGLVNNHEYEFKMFAKLDYGDGGVKNNLRNSFGFTFTLDEEAPIITDCTYEKKYDTQLRKDRYYINVKVYDNQYAMSIQPMAVNLGTVDDSDEEVITSISQMTPLPIPVMGNKGSETTVRFEITDYLEAASGFDAFNSTIALLVDDYALNQAIYLCQFPGDNPSGDMYSSGFSFTADGTSEGRPYTGGTIAFNVEEGEAIDLTKFLATDDPALDADGDYLKQLNWMVSYDDIGEVREGIFLAKEGGSKVLGDKVGSAGATGYVTVYASEDLYGRNAGIQLRVISRGAANNKKCPASLGYADETGVTGLKFSYFDTVEAHQSMGSMGDLGTKGAKIYTASLAGGTDKTVSCYPGESFRLHYSFTPWYAESRYTLTYETNDESVATVEPDGLVKALAEGTAQIRLNVKDKETGVASNIRARLDVNVQNEFVIEGTTLVAYKGLGGNVVIPDDKSITSISSFAFSGYTIDYDIQIGDDDDLEINRLPFGNETITSVTIPEGVKVIGNYAFYGCKKLESVKLPASIKFIYWHAFEGCEVLETVDGFENVRAIGEFAFKDCKALQSATISKTYALGEGAFKGCVALTSADVTSVRNCGAEAFMGCSQLSEVKFDENGNTKLSVNMFRGTAIAELVIYARIAGNMARETLVPSGAFADCASLTKVTLPDGEVSFGTGVFADCAQLQTVEFKKGTKIVSESDLLNGTGVTTFTVPDENETYKASPDGKLLLNGAGDVVLLAAPAATYDETYKLPEAVTRISAGAFSGAKLKTLEIERDVTIGDYAFSGSTLTKLVLPSSAENIIIGNHAFDGSSLAQVENLEKAVQIGAYAFAGTPLVTVTVGGEVGEYAFYGCESLTSATLITGASAGDHAFDACETLATVTLPADGKVTLGEGAFYACHSLATINNLEKVAKIPAYCFAYCVGLESADLSAATAIGDYAFLLCEQLSEVTLAVVETIGEGAFTGAVQTTSIDIINGELPPQITTPSFSDLPGASMGVNEGAYGGDIVLVDVEVLGAPVFTEINLPATLKSIGTGAFYGASKLSSVTIPEGVKSVAPYAFAETPALGAVDLGSVTEIGAHAFANSGVNAIDLSAVVKIGDYAFADYSRLSSVNLAKAEEIGDRAFYFTAYVPVYTKDQYGGYSFQEYRHYDSTLKGEIEAPALKTLGDGAFAYSLITAFNAPQLVKIGAEAFAETKLTRFDFSDGIEKVGAGAFNGAKLLVSYYSADGETDAKLNDYAELIDGVLYTTEKNGDVILNSVPGGKNTRTFTVEEGTSRIEAFAGSENGYIAKLILPDSLKTIGDSAFYHYQKLNTVEFRSMTAPTLEDVGNGSLRMSADDPGYPLMHKYFYFILGGSYERAYCNFVGLVGTVRELKMVVPANVDELQGYDGLLYRAYFGGIAKAEVSAYTAMENNMRTFVESARAISAIIGADKAYDNLRLDDEAIITRAITAYNAIRGDYKNFGYTDEQWSEMYSIVTDARNALSSVRLENASWYARDVQKRMDALPATYDGSAKWRDIYLAITEDYNALSRDDSDALNLTRYNSFRASFEAYSGGVTDGEGLAVWAIALIAVAAVLVAAAAAVTAVVVLKKKKAASAVAETSADGEGGSDEVAPDEGVSADGAESDEGVSASDEVALEKGESGSDEVAPEDGGNTAEAASEDSGNAPDGGENE